MKADLPTNQWKILVELHEFEAQTDETWLARQRSPSPDQNDRDSLTDNRQTGNPSARPWRTLNVLMIRH